MADDVTDEVEEGQASGETGDKSADEDTDREAQKSYETILAQEIETGVTELERPSGGLFLSGLSAGLDVSFSLLLMAVMRTLAEGRLPEPVVEMLVASMYAVGFIFVVLGRSELFTEHTTLAVLPVLDGRASVRQLARLWGIVYVSNLTGAGAFAGIAALVGPALGITEAEAFGKIAHSMTDHSSWVMVASAMLAGWLMGLMSWLVIASRDTVGQILLVWLVTASIGFLHLAHVVVGTTEVLAGLFAGQGITLLDFARFLVLTTFGNALGAFIFVALIKYGHATRAGKQGS
jgi:formate-nitrite transporter family protein